MKHIIMYVIGIFLLHSCAYAMHQTDAPKALKAIFELEVSVSDMEVRTKQFKQKLAKLEGSTDVSLLLEELLHISCEHEKIESQLRALTDQYNTLKAEK